MGESEQSLDGVYRVGVYRVGGYRVGIYRKGCSSTHKTTEACGLPSICTRLGLLIQVAARQLHKNIFQIRGADHHAALVGLGV